MLLPSSSLRRAISVSLGRRDEQLAWIWDVSDRFVAAAAFKSDDILRLICARTRDRPRRVAALAAAGFQWT
jgi:hypothetical protein